MIVIKDKDRYKIIIKIIIFTIIPSLMFFSAKSNSFLDSFYDKGLIGPDIDIILIKDVSLVIGLILSSILLSMNLACKEILLNNISRQRESVLKFQKEIFTSALGDSLEANCTNINLRLFILKNNNLFKVKQKIYKLLGLQEPKKVFVIKNIAGLSDPGITNDLLFEAKPNTQGLVGKCYKERKIVYDDNLKMTINDYNLTDYHKSKTRNVCFCVCAPLFDQNDDIVSIISFDSDDPIKISKEKEEILANMIGIYCQFLYDYLPDLFLERKT